jgi:hypothetical protein
MEEEQSQQQEQEQNPQDPTDEEILARVAAAEGEGGEDESKKDVAVGLALSPLGSASVTLVIIDDDGEEMTATLTPDEAFIIAGNLNAVACHILGLGFMRQIQAQVEAAQLGEKLTGPRVTPGGVHLR